MSSAENPASAVRCPNCGHTYGPFEKELISVFDADAELTVADLAAKLGCSRPQASTTARRMCRKGLLYRFPQILPGGGKRYVYTIYHRGAEA